ncbi:DJ-1/PfpI family protein [Actinoplanes bogorensis]|uniref:DJ-1/PfpI family protein n=2 Tax=Paractinoplanes bogorensis TaxID=1610840 RepID=A0ABS5YQZ7_9ACTN|nr:DJ-1/PfpI family protein [Actinoplanes bogorensis]
MSRDFTARTDVAVPARTLNHDPGRIRVAVLLGASGSVATDVLGPYDVLADSSRFDVYTVSVGTDPVALSGGLTAVPDYGVDNAPAPQIVVVPAFTDPGGDAEKPLRNFIEKVHDRGGLVMSVCAGARVLARTDVLDGRRATSFWSDIGGLRRSNPRTTWVDGVRWLRDGDVMTTAGVSSGIIGALHLVRENAGAEEARRIGERISYPGWDPTATTEESIPVRRVAAADYPYPLHATLPWFQPTYGLGLVDGTGEIDIAAAAELYGGVAFTAHVVPVAERPIVTTAHGLRLIATPIDQAHGLDRLVVPGTGQFAVDGVPVFRPRAEARPGDSAFDPILRDIAARDGHAVATTAAKYIEYPRPELPADAGTPWRIIALTAVTALLAVAPFVRRRRTTHAEATR